MRPTPSAADELPAAEFLSPMPGATMILPETNLIVRTGGIFDAPPSAASIEMSGSVSGHHDGRVSLSDDHRTITFQPDVPFTLSEVVTCRLDPDLATGGVSPRGTFSFTIAGPGRERLRSFQMPPDDDGLSAAPPPAALPAPDIAGPGSGLGASPTAVADTLPPDFPAIHAEVPGTPAPGRLFLTDIIFKARGTPIPSYLMILENDGTPYFYRRIHGVGTDFKMQPSGLLTYFDSAPDAYYAMNARYAVVDSFRCGNGYSTDNHELLLLPNGHALLMSYDPQPMDLSALGGRSDAIVIGLIIQELDTAKNVVFQWRSWDHFQVTDMVYHDITAPVVDYVHANSLDADPEGNLILSSRHMNEVTKISRVSGAILWRLGGVNNQFTFRNEPLAGYGQPFVFSHQHDVKLLPNGHLTMFDNGNARAPFFSRAAEWEIDETAKTATKVWEYRLTPDVFGIALGSVQRLPNGNTLIGWGATTPTLTEVDPAGRIVSKLTFDPGVASYRALRYEWPPVRPAIVEFDPERMPLDPVSGPDRNRGTIRAVIAPESGDFAAGEVLVSTVRLGGTVPADSVNAEAVRQGLAVQFPREEIEPLLRLGANRLEVSGDLSTGERFRGFATLEAMSSSDRPGLNPPRLVSVLGRLPVEVESAAAASGRVVSIYDVRGRLVSRWRSMSGSRRITWDGRSSEGRPLPSGVYMLRVQEPGRDATTKISILR